VSVRRFYFEYHIHATINGRDVVRDKKGPRRAFRLVAIYMWARLKEDGIEGAPRVGQFTLAWQHGFMRWCRDRHQLSGKTISTYLSYIKAGFNFASKPRLITDARDREREVQVLSKSPHVVDSEAEVSKITGLVRSKPRDWIPTDADLAATLDELTSTNPDTAKKREPTFRYVIMALNTMARPEAITELSIKAQVRFDTGIVDMNPPGRLQNKKVRPIIRLTDNLSGWLLYWNLDRPLIYQGKPVKNINNSTLKSAAKRAGVSEWQQFTRYTLRHYMATRVRRVPGCEVSREHRATWMGHTDPDFRTTEEFYESMDADYLENVRQAIDAIMLHLNTLTKRSLLAPSTIPGTRLTVIESRPASDDNSSSEKSA